MLSLMEVILALKGIPLFASVHGQELRRLSEVVHEKGINKGELIFAQNDLGEEMYLVHSGRIGIYQETSKDNVERILEIEPGGFFGEMAILDKLPRSRHRPGGDGLEAAGARQVGLPAGRSRPPRHRLRGVQRVQPPPASRQRADPSTVGRARPPLETP